MSSIYLDYAATTPCDPQVLEAMRPYFFELGGNASSPHQRGRTARKAVEEAREYLAAELKAQANEIIFTSGASESNNHAILATARALKDKGQHIIASSMEHHSLLEPLRRLEAEGFKISYIKPQANGIVSVESIKQVLSQDTILVCLQNANNEVGTIQPVEEIGLLCRARGVYFLVDATQTVGHIPVSVEALRCDFLSLSAHKFYGPQGVGALYIRRGIDLPSLIMGGDQERGRRAGTQNVAGLVGLGKALKLCREQMEDAFVKETALRNSMIDFVLREIPQSQVNGAQDQRLPNNAHFSFDNIDGEELVSALDMAGISVSMGSACTWGQLKASHVLQSMGLSDRMALGSLRVTVGRWTSVEDIRYFLDQLKIKVSLLRGSAKI